MVTAKDAVQKVIVSSPSFSAIAGGLPIYRTTSLLTVTLVLMVAGTGLQVSGYWQAFGGTVADTLSWAELSAAELFAFSIRYPANKMVSTRFMRSYTFAQRPSCLTTVRPDSGHSKESCEARSINSSVTLAPESGNR